MDEKPADDEREQPDPAKPGNPGDRLTLLETIVVFSVSCAVVIFIFAMSAAGLGNYRFRLPEFLTDSVKTVWSLAAAGGFAITASTLDAALRRRPRSVNYPAYVMITTLGLLVPIAGLLWFGRESQRSTLSVPPGATSVDLSRGDFSSRSFALSVLTAPAPVGFLVSGNVEFSGGHLRGNAAASVTRTLFNPPVPGPPATQVVLHLCYFRRPSQGAFPMVAYAPSIPMPSNTAHISRIPIPIDIERVDVPSFAFDIEVPQLDDPSVTWLCGVLATENNSILASVI